MADDFSFSYSLPTGDQSATAATEPVASTTGEATLYAFVDCSQVFLGDSGVLLIHKYSEKQLVVAHEVATALGSCGAFRTLAQHVDVLTTTIPQLAGAQDDVRQVLEMVRAAGLLSTAESVCERIAPESETTQTSRAPTRVFVITCDRPAAIERLLQSMLMAGNLSSHEQLFMIDDSRDSANAALNRELVAKFNLNSPRDMQYIGADAQKQLLEELLVALPEREQSIRFLLDRERWTEHKSYGLSRTLCLLLSIGRRAIVMDDDVVCAAVTSPHTTPGLTFGDTPREVDFYSCEQEILGRTARAGFDPLSGHAKCLGSSLAQAIHTLNDDSLAANELAGANAAYLSQWQADSPILITQTGTIGDPGTVGTEWVYEVGATSAARLLETPQGLEGALKNRHYWMGQPRPLFGKIAIMSQMTGLDNSHLLPPYFPVFRGEDYLFGAMVEFLHPQSVVLEYNWCVPHFPVEERLGNPSTLPKNGRVDVIPGKYITDRTTYEQGISVETRIRHLSVLLKELAETDDNGLLTLYRSEVAESQSALLKRLATRLGDGTVRTEVWQQYLQQRLQNLASAMSEPATPEDTPAIPEGYDSHSILQEFRAYTGEFSIAIEAWPIIRQTAATITSRLLSAGAFTP